MDKPRRSYTEQVKLLASRGMRVDDVTTAGEFLSKVSYYRLSGYFRYWQRDAAHADNRFTYNCSLERVRQLYEAEQALILVCDEILHPLEVLLRTRFAYIYAELIGKTGEFAAGKGFTEPHSPSAPRVEEYALRDLDRSKETFVAHYRKTREVRKGYSVNDYTDMPIWVAVEAFSFGTLSRLIEASGQSGVLATLADSMGVSRTYLPGQIRSFVYLRNRVAHCAKLWNHSVLDVPGLPSNISRRAQRHHRKFGDHSVYKIFIALDEVARRSGIAKNWLSERIDPVLDGNPLLAAGIATPKKYGEMSPELLSGEC